MYLQLAIVPLVFSQKVLRCLMCLSLLGLASLQCRQRASVIDTASCCRKASTIFDTDCQTLCTLQSTALHLLMQ